MGSKKIVEAQGQECFWVNNGPIVKNLSELVDALEEMSIEKFNYHTKRDGNDFAAWVGSVLKDDGLAEKLTNLKTRRGYITALKKYIS